MIHFAPSVYVLQYLDQSTLDDAEIRNKVLGYMMGGKQLLHDSLKSLIYSKLHHILVVYSVIVIVVI